MVKLKKSKGLESGAGLDEMLFNLLRETANDSMDFASQKEKEVIANIMWANTAKDLLEITKKAGKVSPTMISTIVCIYGVMVLNMETPDARQLAAQVMAEDEEFLVNVLKDESKQLAAFPALLVYSIFEQIEEE